MWTNKYIPTERDWYIVKVNNKKQILMWNNHNKFFVDIVGKTYKFDQIECWLDDSKCIVDI